MFLLGPSHYLATRKCVLSGAQEYATPLGEATALLLLPMLLLLKLLLNSSSRCGLSTIWRQLLYGVNQGQLTPAVARTSLAALPHPALLLTGSACWPGLAAAAGPLPIDAGVYAELQATGAFEAMDMDADEVRVCRDGVKGMAARLIISVQDLWAVGDY